MPFPLFIPPRSRKSESTLCYSRLIVFNSDRCHFIYGWWTKTIHISLFDIFYTAMVMACDYIGTRKCVCIIMQHCPNLEIFHRRTTAQGSFLGLLQRRLSLPHINHLSVTGDS